MRPGSFIDAGLPGDEGSSGGPTRSPLLLFTTAGNHQHKRLATGRGTSFVFFTGCFNTHWFRRGSGGGKS